MSVSNSCVWAMVERGEYLSVNNTWVWAIIVEKQWALVENEQLTFQELVAKICKSPSTTSFYLSQLVKDNIVATSKSDFVKVYFNVERKRIANIIEEYHPDIIEQASDNLSDIISSL